MKSNLERLEAGPLNIYLAGRIRKNCWRVPLVGDRQGRIAIDSDVGWSPIKNRIFGIHHYVGPFFISCDHGCGHGESTHGRDSNDCTTGSGDNHVGRIKAFRDACWGIEKCDLFFAYLEDLECYGTLAEIGYAAGIGKPVYICMDAETTGTVANHLWFALRLARKVFHYEEPEAALRLAIDHQNRKQQ